MIVVCDIDALFLTVNMCQEGGCLRQKVPLNVFARLYFEGMHSITSLSPGKTHGLRNELHICFKRLQSSFTALAFYRQDIRKTSAL
jgi:hypothetical protein